MALLTRGGTATQKAIEKAQATVAEWQEKAASVRAETVELEANAGALILADENEAERISIKIQALERKARAYDSAAGEAAQKLKRAHRGALEAAQADEERLARHAEKEYDAHNTAVDSLLAQLKELDGCDFAVAPASEDWARDRGLQQIPKSRGLYTAILKHQTRAAVIAYFLKLGKRPAENYDLNTELGTSFSTLSSSISEVNGWPPIVQEFQDAGIDFEVG